MRVDGSISFDDDEIGAVVVVNGCCDNDINDDLAEYLDDAFVLVKSGPVRSTTLAAVPVADMTLDAYEEVVVSRPKTEAAAVVATA